LLISGCMQLPKMWSSAYYSKACLAIMSNIA